MKIQTKTTLLFTALTATVFFILNITVYFFLSESAHNDFNKRVELRAKISAKYRFEHDAESTESFRELQRQYMEKLPEEKAFILEVEKGAKMTKTPLAPELPTRYLEQIINADGATVFYKKGYRHYAGLLYKENTGDDHIVIKSAVNVYAREMMQHLLIIKIITFICAVALIFTVGKYFSRRTFQPFRDITAKVKQISQGNLHLRLQEQKGSDEIATLITTFNEMLDRLETSFEAQNNFISNASHELRTPLTSIVGEADYALQRERTADGYKQSLENITKQAEKLQHLTKGLLSLAQTGFDGKKQKHEAVRLDQLIFDVKDSVDAIFPESSIKINMHALPHENASMTVMGNYDLLKIAIGNIVMNACKYSNNQKVEVDLIIESALAKIIVKDNGIGIPEKDIKQIYIPFFRASNVKDYEGYGIGMPLSNNIIRIHRGSIDINSKVNIGTQVTVNLPICLEENIEF